MNRNKLQNLLSKLNGADEKTSEGFMAFDKGVEKLKEELKNKIQISTLDEVNNKLNSFKKNVDLKPLIEAVDKIKADFDAELGSLIDQFNEKSQQLADLSKSTGKEVSDQLPSIVSDISDLRSQILSVIGTSNNTLGSLREEIKPFYKIESNLNKKLEDLKQEITDLDDRDLLNDEEKEKEIGDLKTLINKNRNELLNVIANKGGGSMNRKITFNGVDYLTRYTDINYKSGGTVSYTIRNNDQTKMVDVTISATGGSGGSVREIDSVSINTLAGSTSGTDYAYLVSGTTQITLPTAISNTNLYTIKNVGTGVVTVATTSAQTIDGNLTITMPVQFTSIDLISDSANWNIT
jgi:hypothetical protein